MAQPIGKTKSTSPLAAVNKRATEAPDWPRFPVVDDDPPDPLEGHIWINRVDSKLKCIVDGVIKTVTLT